MTRFVNNQTGRARRSARAVLALLITCSFVHAADSTKNAIENAATNSPDVVTNQMLLAASSLTNVPAAAQTNSSAASTKDVAGFDEFKLITQRNIFDPNRRAPRPRGSPEDHPKPTRIDYINLVGAMSYEKGRFAFFDGNNSEYRKSVKPGDTIAGYKVSDVAQNKVTLQRDDKKIELPVGGQLKREDEGEWRLNSSPENFAASTNSPDSSSSSSSSNSTPGSSSSSSSSDESNPILKRLMEQRRQGK